MRRQPVVEEKPWATETTLRTMGVDPGFGALGVAVLERTAKGRPRVVTLRTIKTKKAPKKQRHNLRVSDDDKRRLREIWDALMALVLEYDVNAGGAEVYEAYGKKTSAWKTAMSYALIHGVGFATELMVFPFRVNDLKQEFLGKPSGTKAEVQDYLAENVDGFAEALAQIAKDDREHCGDAAGHALLTLWELDKIREMAGVRL